MFKKIGRMWKNFFDYKALSREKKKKLAYRLMGFSPLGLIVPIVPGLFMFGLGVKILSETREAKR